MTPQHGTAHGRDTHPNDRDRAGRHVGYADERWVTPLDATRTPHAHPQDEPRQGPPSPAPIPPRWIRMRCGDTTIEVEWPEPASAGAAPVVTRAPVAAASPVEQPAEPDSELRFVCAPMVGTFYHAPEVGAKPFVSVGDIVRHGQTVGILEIMKMMNTITADVSGEVVEVIAPDAHPVEYQQPLIAIEPRTAGPDGRADHNGGDPGRQDRKSDDGRGQGHGGHHNQRRRSG